MTEAQLSTAVIENPEMLQYQRRQQQLDHKGPAARDAGPAARDTGSASSVAGVVNGESLEDIRKVRARPGAPRTPPAAFPPSVFPSGEPGVSGDFWGSQEGCQGPFRPSGRNRGLPLRRRRGQG